MRLTKYALLFLLSGFLLPSPETAAQAQPQEAVVTAIRTAYQRINAQHLKQERFSYESPGCVDGGEVSYFSAGKEILKITESGSIGDGSWTREFYYQSGKMIFCYEQITGGPAIGPVTRNEYRIYCNNDRPIRYMEGKKTVPPNSKAVAAVQTAYKILKAYRTRDFAAALCN